MSQIDKINQIDVRTKHSMFMKGFKIWNMFF